MGCVVGSGVVVVVGVPGARFPITRTDVGREAAACILLCGCTEALM